MGCGQPQISSSLKPVPDIILPDKAVHVSSAIFLVVTNSVFAISQDGQVLSPCHKAPRVSSCQSSSAATSLEGLRLAGKKDNSLCL